MLPTVDIHDDIQNISAFCTTTSCFIRIKIRPYHIYKYILALRWLKTFLSLFPPWNFLFAWPQSYLHQLLSSGYVILPSAFHGKKVDRVQPKFLHLSKGKTIHGNALKILSPHFSCRKIGCSNTLKIENLQNVQNPEGYPQKENRQRTVRSSACCSIYFRNRIVRSRFRLSYFVTVLIQVSARTLPSSAAMQIEIRLWTLVAHAGRNFCIRFLICSNGAFCCSVRVALSFVSSRTTVTNDPPLSVPFAILCTVFFKEWAS